MQMASSSSGCGLNQILRSLCLNTEWKYAVFWKLKHRARMVLTCEDAYYDHVDQHDPLNHCFRDTVESLDSGYHSRDALGLAVAKMSYNVYSLGEGIVGQVAVSGKHQWIFADKHANSYCSLFESQFAAGIRTIVVVSVVPHGVVQLGSLNKVYEDVKLVSRIRNVFFALQESSVGHISSSVECSTKSSLFKQDFPTKVLDSEVIPLDKAVQKEWPHGLLPELAHRQKYSDSSFVLPVSNNHPKQATQVENKHEGLQLSSAASDSNLEHQNQLGRHLINNAVCKGETDGWKDMSLEPENVYANRPAVGSVNLYNVALPAEQYGAGHACYSSNLLSSALSDMVKPSGLSSYPNVVLDIPKSSNIKFQNNLRLRNQNDLVDMDSINTSFKFSAGYELYEVLGPTFLGKSIYADSQVDNAEAGANIEMQEGMSCSQLTFESGSENLVEAVVANVFHSGSDMKSERSFCRSALSSLTTGNTPEPSILTKSTINSADYSINKSSLVEVNKQNCLNSSGLCGSMSSKAHSSPCLSNCEQLERSLEPSKNNKKTARPGEKPRPRPRDRQLIQDRIKELRELVPNGAKCSIDSLLEHTIKHMVFLQGITKHADKLGKCADSKMYEKGAGILGSSNYEQGSSWAVEVGSHLKVCSIVVENINKNGQMRVELLFDECSHFLEIAEAIRSLGLTILKGFTEAHGDKTWICFVVEGQNKVFHRMDILWSLVQILQSKATS
ncbi:transcription factor EMB1444-like isoform X2 [Hibiscus syriacus]|uniref:transcription factor EMB1444-like isoform X2 n=1 Tax=Hibiscus syriacus TaxID=106335 RepID=UPI001921B872|nr:transcription factor EMB1444-like isoform X2 [Hibiscus syriacus]